ncbi:hypothetical protein H5410_017564 [Solanum commersonii]|uniref:Uncharacterized protein n=1 Tax=Solanum commersonii TaxID=4109 RepID=A0A9J6A0R0_SOLCO|nr:hypothetical protein H5410_017564 [Solanum commersonii]
MPRRTPRSEHHMGMACRCSRRMILLLDSKITFGREEDDVKKAKRVPSYKQKIQGSETVSVAWTGKTHNQDVCSRAYHSQSFSQLVT